MTAKRVNRRRPRRRHTKKNPTTTQLAKRIKKIEHEQDLKWFDSEYQISVPLAGGALMSDFLYILPGTGSSQRIGSKIKPTSIQIKLTFRASLSALGATNIRMIVFWDSQSNGTQPTLVGTDNTLMDNTIIGALAALSPIYCPFNHNTVQRFHILYDRIYTINPNTFSQFTAPDVTELVTKEVFVRKNIKLNRIVRYDTNNGNASDMTSNALHVAFFADQPVNGEPSVIGGIRLYYKDT